MRFLDRILGRAPQAQGYRATVAPDRRGPRDVEPVDVAFYGPMVFFRRDDRSW
ncbi:hypothetical protein [Isoptericola aurantiacus]|uniref:hypothetical protein n=1 Tax=Isoptericola aurantiacus TaxID=3377839 RepID=UPI00383B196A